MKAENGKCRYSAKTIQDHKMLGFRHWSLSQNASRTKLMQIFLPAQRKKCCGAGYFGVSFNGLVLRLFFLRAVLSNQRFYVDRCCSNCGALSGPSIADFIFISPNPLQNLKRRPKRDDRLNIPGRANLAHLRNKPGRIGK